MDRERRREKLRATADAANKNRRINHNDTNQ
jgi:hypothetical protein